MRQAKTMNDNTNRKHYMTLCFKNNTSVFCTINDGWLEVTFERTNADGYLKSLVLGEGYDVIKNDGFNSEEILYFKDFLKRHKQVMKKDVMRLL